MSMMTHGLEQAAGLGLQHILRGATRTRWRALGSGLLVVSSLALDALEREVARLAHVATAQAGFGRALDMLFALGDPERESRSSDEQVDSVGREMQSACEALKSTLLDAGAGGRLDMTTMETALRRIRALRRAGQQPRKAHAHATADVDVGQVQPTTLEER
jgi:Na+/phosphate symporter